MTRANASSPILPPSITAWRSLLAEDDFYAGEVVVALERGLGWKKMAMLFSLFTAFASFGIGSTVQANAISTITHQSYAVSPWVMGGIICIITAVVIIGGVKSIARVCGALVPFMAIFYVVGCIYILIVNGPYVWPALKIIVESAFNPSLALPPSWPLRPRPATPCARPSCQVRAHSGTPW